MARKADTPAGFDLSALVAEIAAKVESSILDEMALALPGSPENPVERPAKATRKSTRTVGKRTPQARKPKNTPAVACVTAGDAWLALGGDAQYEPQNPDKPANNAQLWRLNTAGMLRIVG